MKKLASILLILAILCSILCVTVFATDNTTLTVTSLPDDDCQYYVIRANWDEAHTYIKNYRLFTSSKPIYYMPGENRMITAVSVPINVYYVDGATNTWIKDNPSEDVSDGVLGFCSLNKGYNTINGTVLYTFTVYQSSNDIYYYGTSNVFFSVEQQTNLQVSEILLSGALLPTVFRTSLRVLPLALAVLGILLGVSLIPKVIHFFSK